MSRLRVVLADVLPTDHSRQVHVRDALAEYVARAGAGETILDLGCGDGRALDIVRNHSNGFVGYVGIDIEDSPEVRSRSRDDAQFLTFDGINIPFEDATFDCVYACSVLEHVRYPEQLLAEVARVLKPRGAFIGSVSYLEPYHSFSIFNMTPYGLVTVLKAAGLTPVWLRPGIDGITLILRSLWAKKYFSRWFHSESPLNRIIAAQKKLRQRSVQDANAAKLGVAGHIVFYSERPSEA